MSDEEARERFVEYYDVFCRIGVMLIGVSSLYVIRSFRVRPQ